MTDGIADSTSKAHPGPTADEVAPEYDDTAIRFLEALWGEGFLSPGGPDEVRRVVADLDFSGKRVLDIGCGSGGITLFLAREYRPAEIVGYDVEQPVVDLATRRALEQGLDGIASFVRGEPGPLPFPVESFDIVFSKDALIHVADKEALFTDIFRLLKPGGRFAASDWLTSHDGAPSEAMRTYLSAEGLSFGKLARACGLSSSTLVQRFDTEINASHDSTSDDIRASVAAISSKKQMIQNWASAKREIMTIAPASRFIGKPAHFSHRFGQAMQGFITAGARAADQKMDDKTLKIVRDRINAGSGAFAAPKQSLSRQIYTKSDMSASITAGVKKAVEDDKLNAGQGADFTIKEPPILTSSAVKAYKRRAAREHFDRKMGSLQAAAQRGDLRYSPGTDAVREAELQAKFRADMKAKKLDISPFTWDEVEADHSIDLVVGGAADGELTMLSKGVNSSVGAQLKSQARKHKLAAGDPIRSLTVVKR